MNSFRIAALALGALVLFRSHPAFAAEKKLVIAYVPNWVDLKSFAETIDYGKLTHINIAFENPTNGEGDLSFNSKDEALIAKAREHQVKVLVSIGGGAASGNVKLMDRYFDLLSDTKRVKFAEKLSAYVESHHLDGLDVDIEGPSINNDYGPFVAELAKIFHAKGQLLTAALSKGYGGNKVPDSALTDLDLVNIMAYDGAGSWAPNAPGQHSSMPFTKSNVAYWLKRGLPKSKAVLGVPFYGYGFGDAYRKGDYAYSEIVAKYPGAESLDQVGDTIWYNGMPTIKAKAQYVVEEGLAGVMIWSLDNDVKGEKSLLGAIEVGLKSSD